MSFDWLNNFQKALPKSDDYAEKTLAQYRLGMKSKGAIKGVTIKVDESGCAACKRLKPGEVYDPDDAPRLPLPECTRRQDCGCVYRPMMAYQLPESQS